MMTELALHILDIANNSTRAGAKNVAVTVSGDTVKDTLAITVSDDGCGMDKQLLARVTDPFATTRTTRKVGLGIPLFKQAAEFTGGGLQIDSRPGEGTTVKAVFGLKHVDRVPLGRLGQTFATLIGGAPDTEFSLVYELDGRKYEFSTREIRTVMDGVPLSEPEVSAYIGDMIDENIENINGGQPI
ncbi:MAG: sensor histidine kinase [Christensenellales bacterium]